MSKAAYDELTLAEDAYLRACGWALADPDAEGAQPGDWVPPWDRANFWDRDRALAHQKARDEAANAEGEQR